MFEEVGERTIGISKKDWLVFVAVPTLYSCDYYYFFSSVVLGHWNKALARVDFNIDSGLCLCWAGAENNNSTGV